MSEHRATIHWHRQGTAFTPKEYTRDHVWKFDGGSEIGASAAPQYLGNPSSSTQSEHSSRRYRVATC